MAGIVLKNSQVIMMGKTQDAGQKKHHENMFEKHVQTKHKQTNEFFVLFLIIKPTLLVIEKTPISWPCR
jgi:hypothetical protein